MPKIPKLVESRKWLYQKAAVERLSVPAIAKLAGCGCWKVYNRMQKFGIPRNPRGFCLSREGKDNYMKRPGVVNPFKGKTHSGKTRKILRQKASVPKPHLRKGGNGMYGRTGESNPNWKGGTTPERQSEYANEQWKDVAAEVRERDNYCCRRCGRPKLGPKGLHVHHILGWTEYPEFRFDPCNCVTLCKICHDWVHSNMNLGNEWIGKNAKAAFEAILANG